MVDETRQSLLLNGGKINVVLNNCSVTQTCRLRNGLARRLDFFFFLLSVFPACESVWFYYYHYRIVLVVHGSGKKRNPLLLPSSPSFLSRPPLLRLSATIACMRLRIDAFAPASFSFLVCFGPLSLLALPQCCSSCSTPHCTPRYMLLSVYESAGIKCLRE